MALVTMPTATVFVVRDGDGRVVVAFWGSAATDEASDWRARGYRVECVDSSTLD